MGPRERPSWGVGQSPTFEEGQVMSRFLGLFVVSVSMFLVVACSRAPQSPAKQALTAATDGLDQGHHGLDCRSVSGWDLGIGSDNRQRDRHGRATASN